MAIDKHKCFVPYCDQCKNPFEDDFVPHFDSEVDAQRVLENDWIKKGKKLIYPEYQELNKEGRKE